MSEDDKPGSHDASVSRYTESIKGRMPLFDQPELLTKEDHGHLGLRSKANSFEFAKTLRAVPIVLTEFRSVQRYSPIVFTGQEDQLPVAIVGIIEDHNLFVGESGEWSVPGYIPAYLRCYPFALATAADQKYAVIFDRASAMVAEHPQVPFFEDDEITAPVQQRIDLCRSFQADRQRTSEACQKLRQLGLLTVQHINQTVDGQEETIGSYHAIDHRKLQELEPETITEFLRDGTLAAIVAHLFSLDMWPELLRRRKVRQAKAH